MYVQCKQACAFQGRDAPVPVQEARHWQLLELGGIIPPARQPLFNYAYLDSSIYEIYEVPLRV